MTMSMATKRRGFWGWSIFSAWWYIILLAIFWFLDNLSGGLGAGGTGIMQHHRVVGWKYHADGIATANASQGGNAR